MTLKTFGFGTMVAATVVGMTVASAPAQASILKAGQDLNLSGDSRLEIGTGAKTGTALLNFSNSTPFMTASYSNKLLGKAIVTGTSNPVFGVNTIAILKDLKLVGGGTTFSLAETVNSFITLTNGIKFNLETFVLNRTAVGASGFTKWDADYTGTFVSDNTVDGFGSFTTQGKVLSVGGSSFSSSTTTIPTPALLPGLLGLGIAALRKRKSEETDMEAAETAKA